jgi:AhpD family alkylhydroperoxidase
MTRLNPYIAANEQMKRLIDYSIAAVGSIEPTLAHLVKVRVSQINGCAICVHMHAGEALKDGETQERIWLLDAWHEAGIYTSREKAALTWAEALTRLSETHAPDEAYATVTSQFTEAEVVDLTMLINAINSFNRIGVGFRLKPIGLAQIAA